MVSDAEREDTKDTLDTLSSGVNFGLTGYIEGEGIDLGKVINALLVTTLPWVIFLVFSIFGWMSSSSSCCCDGCCPPCKTCRRQYNEKPYTEKEKWVYSGIALTFNVVVISASIAGLVLA